MAGPVVIELLVRLDEVTYDQAEILRNLMREPGPVRDKWVSFVLAAARTVGAENAAPSSPWAEWRPARGRRPRQQGGSVAAEERGQ